VADWLAHEGRIALWWVVALARLRCRVLRPEKGDALALSGGCALACGPFLRGVPILSADERAELGRFVEVQIPGREGEVGGPGRRLGPLAEVADGARSERMRRGKS
jgi:hypothetical protein